MSTISNRRARRAAQKDKHEPLRVMLMPYPGNTVTAGTWLDILNTSWRGADKCTCPCDRDMNWLGLLHGLKLYFAPITTKFKVVEWTAWDDNTEFLFTSQGSVLLLNIVFRRDDGTFTLCYRLPGCVFDFGDVSGMLVKQSSSFFSLVYGSWKMSVTRYTQVQKVEMRDTYLSSGHDKDYADIMSGLYPQTDIEANVAGVLATYIITPLLRIFKTLAFMDYSRQRGLEIMQTGSELFLSSKAIADIEAICVNHSRSFSNIPVMYKDGEDGDSTVVGNCRSFYKVHGEGVTSKDIALLRTAVVEESLDLDAITENSRDKFVVLDKCGNPLLNGGVEEYESGSWLITATGLHTSSTNSPIYGFHVNDGSEYRFVKFAVLLDILSTVEKEVEGIDKSRWAPILDSKFELMGRGLRSSIDIEEDIPACVRYYSCSNEFLSALPENSNIQNLDQANFFIEGFLRMLRRKKVPGDTSYTYCTGMVSKDGGFICFRIPNLYDNLSNVKPHLFVSHRLPDTSGAADDYKFFRDPRYLRLENADIKIDGHAFVHMLEEREYRVPVEVERESRPQLMEWIRDSLRFAKAILEYNPYFAQPCYSERLDKICFLLPLYSDGKHDAEHLIAAMFVNRGRVATIYSKDMARDHACLFPFPKAIWLH